MKPTFLLGLPLATSLVTGCLTDSNAESPLPENLFSELQHGYYTNSGTFTKKQSKVITGQSDYEDELLNYTSDTPQTADFSQGRVLLVDMGPRNTGGYDITVKSVDVTDEYITAHVQLSIPGDNCTVTQAFTNPYQFVYIPTTKEVLISESYIRSNCTP